MGAGSATVARSPVTGCAPTAWPPSSDPVSTGPAVDVTVMEPERAAVGAPVQVTNASSRRNRSARAAGGVIEIDLPLGRVRVTGAVDLAALRVVIEALSQ